MSLNFLKWQLNRTPLLRLVLLRTVMLLLALIILSLMQIAREVRVIEPIMSNADECSLNVESILDLNFTSPLHKSYSVTFPLFGKCGESENLTEAVFKELMGKNLLRSNARALCVGEGSPSAVKVLRGLGLVDAFGVDKHPFFSLLKRRFVYELNFEDDRFDFVFSGDLDRVSVPSLLVMEIERVLRPGGTGAILVGGCRVSSPAPVVSFLKSSDVVQLCGVDSFSLVLFKKRVESNVFFEHFRLPADCPSVATNKPFMKYIEPLMDQSKLSHLPNFMNISSRNKLVFINIGAGEFAKAGIAKISKLYQSTHRAALEVFVIDHKTSVLSSYVTDPGINFVYYPALGGDTVAPELSSQEHLDAPIHEETFDFVSWFNEMISGGEFVVLMMNAKSVELNILVELFKTGAICHVDELFLRCSDSETTMFGNCMNLFASLRKGGVYVHQWFED